MHIRDFIYMHMRDYIAVDMHMRVRGLELLLSTVILKGDITPIPYSKFQNRCDYSYNVIVKTS